MKKVIISFVLFSVFSCSYIINKTLENNISDSDNLEVAIKNNTNVTFNRTELTTSDGTVVYQVTNPGALSNFIELNFVYSEVALTIETDEGFFSFTPNSLNENTKVTKGMYYFEVNFVDDQTISITRKKL